MKIAAIADIHYRVNSRGIIQQLLAGVEKDADMLLLPGDITDTGMPAEMELLLADLRDIAMPKISVLGNHDHESDEADELTRMMRDEGIYVLEDNVVEMDGVGFVGSKGFCGGFGEQLIQPFGELALKEFTMESIMESSRLENCIADIESGRRVVILHYAPVRQTLVGESVELYPFLGTSRLADAVDRHMDHHSVDFVVHGHSHYGSPEGATHAGVPVYNVCRFVLTRHGLKPYRVFEV